MLLKLKYAIDLTLQGKTKTSFFPQASFNVSHKYLRTQW